MEWVKLIFSGRTSGTVTLALFGALLWAVGSMLDNGGVVFAGVITLLIGAILSFLFITRR